MKTKNKKPEAMETKREAIIIKNWPFRFPMFVVGIRAFDVRCWALGVGRLLRVPFRRPSTAFTLVELIVVVAIIALLIGLLIPNIRTAREKAWGATCQNNLRQFGMAQNQYLLSASSSGGGSGVDGGVYGIDSAENKIYPGNPGAMVLSPQVGGGTLDSGRYFSGGAARGGLSGSSSAENYLGSIIASIPNDVTLQSLSAGRASIRVCPAVLRQIQKGGNYFDINSPNYKGDHAEPGQVFVYADFQAGFILATNPTQSDVENATTNTGYDLSGELVLSGFTTYAPNPYANANSPQNVIAFIDWNAQEGWGAYLAFTNWMFTGRSADGNPVMQDTPKWTNAWWLTEVGFYHPLDNEYGANYVAMDGHVGWVSSNAISIANFTTNQ